MWIVGVQIQGGTREGQEFTYGLANDTQEKQEKTIDPFSGFADRLPYVDPARTPESLAKAPRIQMYNAMPTKYSITWKLLISPATSNYDQA